MVPEPAGNRGLPDDKIFRPKPPSLARASQGLEGFLFLISADGHLCPEISRLLRELEPGLADQGENGAAGCKPQFLEDLDQELLWQPIKRRRVDPGAAKVRNFRQVDELHIKFVFQS